MLIINLAFKRLEMLKNKTGKIIGIIALLATLFTLFYYTHETFPKPVRAITALAGTPVAVASGIAHYANLDIQVYNTPWAVILSNVIAAALFVLIAYQFYQWRKNKLTH